MVGIENGIQQGFNLLRAGVAVAADARHQTGRPQHQHLRWKIQADIIDINTGKHNIFNRLRPILAGLL